MRPVAIYFLLAVAALRAFVTAAKEQEPKATVLVRLKDGVSPESLVTPGSLKGGMECFTTKVASISKAFSSDTIASLSKRGDVAATTSSKLDEWYYLEQSPELSSFDTTALCEANPCIDACEVIQALEPPGISEWLTNIRTPNFLNDQSYLDAGPIGIDARFAWNIDGGDGRISRRRSVTLYNIEYNWNTDHGDLTKIRREPFMVPDGTTFWDIFGNKDHGTASLGIIISDRNRYGTTGIAYDAAVKLVSPAFIEDGVDRYNPASAILLAANDASPGDVILLQQQAFVCGMAERGPLEFLDSVFQAIETATSLGITVVAPAGNGGVDLDGSVCRGKFDRNVRDSGAILVGAGFPSNAAVPRQRMPFSSYGSRVDLQGWGDAVFTTGYGDGYFGERNPDDPNLWYSNDFDGTSSAAAMVAGAAVSAQGMAIAFSGQPLSPREVRALLRNTGRSQEGPNAANENIGPLPDLRKLYATLVGDIGDQ